MARRRLTPRALTPTEADTVDHTVYWGHEKQTAVQPRSVPYLMLLATKLHGFASQRRRSILNSAKKLSLDRASRIDRIPEDLRPPKDRQATGKKKKRQGGADYETLYRINKGLTLELLMSFAMYRLMSPACSRANCTLAFQWPSNASPAGHPDISVEVGEGSVVHVEVSAREELKVDDFFEQLKSALKHMIDKEADWALLVTEWDLQKSKTVRPTYNIETLFDGDKKYGDKYDEQWRNVIIMSLREMADLNASLSADRDFHARRTRLTAANVSELLEALKAAQEQFRNKRDENKQDKEEQDVGQPDAEQPDEEKQGKKKKKPPENLREVWLETTKNLLKT